MTDRNKLIEILQDTLHEWECDVSIKTLTEITEHLIENGVICLPCQVGTVVYIPEIEVDKIERRVVTKIYRTTVDEYSVNARYIMYHTRKCNNFTDSMLGKTVFLTRKEAEKALEEKK